MTTLTYFPSSRVSKLATHFASLSREKAVVAATRELEFMRRESDLAILLAVARLENIVNCTTNWGEPGPMEELLTPCDQIVTLAGTFGYEALEQVTRNLCDLIDGLYKENKNDLAAGLPDILYQRD